MQFADLHIHSNYSDGLYSPYEILKTANDKNIKYLSITDHDTICYKESDYSSVNNIKSILIPGIEISTEYKSQEVHILGYFIDTNNKNLLNYLDLINKARTERIYEILNKLKKNNIEISLDELNIYKSISVGRSHVAKIMVSKGYVTNFKAAFQNYLGKDKTAYVERYKIPYKEALNLINSIGGISSLAHPGEIYKKMLLENLIKDFKAYGLNGIEVFHPSHSKEETNTFYNLAKKYKFIITGGSDCHGVQIKGDILMGRYGLDENLMNKLLSNKLINNWGR